MGEPTHNRARGAEWVATAVVGILLGAAPTSALAGEPAERALTRPTVTGILVPAGIWLWQGRRRGARLGLERRMNETKGRDH